jgi:glucose-6-phosphate isomerase
MLTKNINLKNLNFLRNNEKIKKDLKKLLSENNQIIKSLGPKYKNNFNKSIINKIKKFKYIRLIGMGGSILGTEAIHDFLKHKIKKNVFFYNNLNSKIGPNKTREKVLNVIVSKSGNTLETIVNTNILIKKKDHNIFLTENKNNYLQALAHKLKSEVVHHNNFIGGRYSVLSEVGMLPAELMGLSVNNFKQINNLVKNNKFLKMLVSNVSSLLYLHKHKKFNSIILNYDQESQNFLRWYQQLVAESLGKKGHGILPIISSMPKDNHSLMQLYLDGPKNNFFTFFYSKIKRSTKINAKGILKSHNYLKNKSIDKIMYSQKNATEAVFLKKKIPFRSFEIFNKNEKTLGELFSFFILETILIGRALKINPYDQPSVELIKKETKKILI